MAAAERLNQETFPWDEESISWCLVDWPDLLSWPMRRWDKEFTIPLLESLVGESMIIVHRYLGTRKSLDSSLIGRTLIFKMDYEYRDPFRTYLCIIEPLIGYPYRDYHQDN
jgi:hypothetical protein